MPIEELYQLFLKSTGVNTDTRTLQTNQIFFALKGPNFNANELATEAIQKGALAAIIDDAKFDQHEKTIFVQDALTSLQGLATYHRQQLFTTVIAITGSNGKTTSKELAAAVLRSQYTSYATEGNLNNHIGLPLSVLRIKPEHQFAILELGDNHPGEVALLANICQPHIGVVTNVGKDHLEGFGTMEANYKAKAELFDYLRNNGNPAFLDADLLDLRKWADGINPIIRYGTGRACNIQGILLYAAPFVQFKFKDKDKWYRVNSQLYGKYNFSNLLLAVAIGQYFEVPTEKIVTALESYVPGNNRSQILKIESNKVVLDAYNANPSNVMAALDQFRQIPSKNKIVILGDMLELGSFAAAEHQSVLKEALSLNPRTLITVGAEFEKPAREMGVAHYSTAKELKGQIDWDNWKEAWILIKGSRGVGLEAILPD